MSVFEILQKIRDEITPEYRRALDLSTEEYYGGEYDAYVHVFSVLDDIEQELKEKEEQ